MLPPISTRIVEFLGYDLTAIGNTQACLDELRFAQMAWNYSIFTPSSPEFCSIDTALLKLPEPIRTKLYARLIELSERKKKMYPDDFRVIHKIDVLDSKKKYIVRASHADYREIKRKSDRPSGSGNKEDGNQ